MEIVKAVDYGISAPSGTKVLRLVAPGMASGSWRYYFKLMAPVLKMSALGNLTDEQFENAYFCWDAYNNSSAEFNIVAVFEVGSGGKDYRVGTYPKPGQWTTFRIKLTDIVSAAQTVGKRIWVCSCSALRMIRTLTVNCFSIISALKWIPRTLNKGGKVDMKKRVPVFAMIAVIIAAVLSVTACGDQNAKEVELVDFPATVTEESQKLGETYTLAPYRFGYGGQ